METGTIFSGFVRRRRSAAIAAIVVLLGSAAPALAQVHVPNLPPARAAAVRPVVWRWNGFRWVWVVPGPRYYPPGPPVRRWIPGHWIWGPYGRRWVPPHWG